MPNSFFRLAQRLNKRYALKRPMPPVFLMGDDEKQPDLRPLLPKLPKGSAIIIRSKNPLVRKQHILALKKSARRLGLLIMIADDWRLARAYHLDGLHIPEQRLKKFTTNRGYWRKPYPNFILTASAHSPQASWRAAQSGMDGVFISPIFPTTSHPNARTLGRWQVMNRIRQHPTSLANIGLGGINHQTIHRVKDIPLSAIAGISGIIE